MGASSSRDSVGYGAGYVPRLQMIPIRADETKRLVIPVKAVATCGLTAGDTVYFRDSLSRSFHIIIQYQGGTFFLGPGWARMLKRIDCSIGNQLLLKYKGGRTWNVFVFSSSSGGQKFPLRAAPHTDGSIAESSNQVTNVHHAGQGSPTPAVSSKAPTYLAGEGTMEHPIDIDDPKEVVYNALGTSINTVMAEFFDNIANTFDLRVLLYYGNVGPLDLSCDFIALDMEFGKEYLLPALREHGQPEHVKLYLNGGAEPVCARLQPSYNGSVILCDGWADFLNKHDIKEGVIVVLRFEFGVTDINVNVYDF